MVRVDLRIEDGDVVEVVSVFDIFLVCQVMLCVSIERLRADFGDS